jgi:hypothetical protein
MTRDERERELVKDGAVLARLARSRRGDAARCVGLIDRIAAARATTPAGARAKLIALRAAHRDGTRPAAAIRDGLIADALAALRS